MPQNILIGVAIDQQNIVIVFDPVLLACYKGSNLNLYGVMSNVLYRPARGSIQTEKLFSLKTNKQ